MRARRSLALLIGFGVLFAPRPGSGQTEFGASAGAALGWPQDVTLEARDSRGHTLGIIHENSLTVDRGEVWQVGGSHWWHAPSSFGVEFEVVGWRNPLTVFLSPSMTQERLRQEHTAVLANLTGRLALSTSARSYVYGGLGGGPVASWLTGSRVRVGPALSLLAGICFPAETRSLSFCLDSRYLITRDFDAIIRENGTVQNLEFSGHPSIFAARPILGPHMDSRFLAVLLGVRWSHR